MRRGTRTMLLRRPASLRVALTAAVGLILLAACGGGSSRESTTTTVRNATTRQIAGIVAQFEDDILGADATVRACEVDFAGDRCGLTGSLKITTLGLRAETLALDLDAADDARPNNGLFVGAYPTEVRSLAKRTIDHARKLQAEVKRLLDEFRCGAEPTGEYCVSSIVRVAFAYDALRSDIRAWSPYL
jgi:hypothetical protein